MEEQRAHELVQLEGHTPHTYLRTLNFTLGGARYRETDENDVFKSSEYLHKLYGYISDPDSVSKVYGSPFNFAEHDVQKALAWQRKLDPISVTETRLKLMVRFMEDDDFKPPVEWLPLFLIVTSRAKVSNVAHALSCIACALWFACGDLPLRYLTKERSKELQEVYAIFLAEVTRVRSARCT